VQVEAFQQSEQFVARSLQRFSGSLLSCISQRKDANHPPFPGGPLYTLTHGGHQNGSPTSARAANALGAVVCPRSTRQALLVIAVVALVCNAMAFMFFFSSAVPAVGSGAKQSSTASGSSIKAASGSSLLSASTSGATSAAMTRELASSAVAHPGQQAGSIGHPPTMGSAPTRAESLLSTSSGHSGDSMGTAAGTNAGAKTADESNMLASLQARETGDGNRYASNWDGDNEAVRAAGVWGLQAELQQGEHQLATQVSFDCCCLSCKLVLHVCHASIYSRAAA
jgi:hypothetical protein